MLFGSLGAAAANLALLAAGGVGVAIVLRFLTGACLAAVYPPALKAMSTWFKQGRGTALGVMVGALTLGSALPHLVNGLGGVDWEAVIVVTSVLTAAGGLLAEFGGRRWPLSVPHNSLQPAGGGKRAFRQRKVSARQRWLLRPHVGALRHVGLVRRLHRRHASRSAAGPTTKRQLHS